MQAVDLSQEDIHTYLARHQKKELLRFLTCGSVDDGKSTLIGRLLHDTSSRKVMSSFFNGAASPRDSRQTKAIRADPGSELW